MPHISPALFHGEDIIGCIEQYFFNFKLLVLMAYEMATLHCCSQLFCCTSRRWR